MADEAWPLAEQCWATVHATEALLTILQEQKIKQAMTSSYIAPGAPEGKSSQIYDLDQDDQIYIHEDGTPVFKLHELFTPICCYASEHSVMARSCESRSD